MPRSSPGGGEGLGTAGSSVAPSSQGTGYSGFQVTGMFECGQKSTLPPEKKIHRVSNKTQKIPAQKLPLPPPAKNNMARETLYPGTGTVPEF